MKLSVMIAFILYAIGLLFIIDWISFWHNNGELATGNFISFKQHYINHLPGFIRPFYAYNSLPATLLMILSFLVSGIIFWKRERRVYKLFGISAFIFGGWGVFSLM